MRVCEEAVEVWGVGFVLELAGGEDEVLALGACAGEVVVGV